MQPSSVQDLDEKRLKADSVGGGVSAGDVFEVESNSASTEDENFPDGGLEAWLVVFGVRSFVISCSLCCC